MLSSLKVMNDCSWEMQSFVLFMDSHVSRKVINKTIKLFLTTKMMNPPTGSELFCLKTRHVIGRYVSSNDSVCETFTFLLTQMKVIPEPARNRVPWHREPPGINEVKLSKRDPPRLSGERAGSCICVVVMFPLMDTKPQRSRVYEEVEGVWLGARRDAASCSHDWVTLSTRVVKRDCGLSLRLIPPTVSAWPVWFSLWISNSYHAVILPTGRLR